MRRILIALAALAALILATGALGQHHVDAVLYQLRTNRLEPALVADQAHRPLHAQNWLNHVKRHSFRQRIGNAHRQAQGVIQLFIAQAFGHLLAQLKNLVGITKGNSPSLSQTQTPTHRLKKRPSKGLFQLGNLAGKRLGAQAQAFCRRSQAAGVVRADHAATLRAARDPRDGGTALLGAPLARRAWGKITRFAPWLRVGSAG